MLCRTLLAWSSRCFVFVFIKPLAWIGNRLHAHWTAVGDDACRSAEELRQKRSQERQQSVPARSQVSKAQGRANALPGRPGVPVPNPRKRDNRP